MNKALIYTVGVAIVVMAFVSAFGILTYNTRTAFGSVSVTDEYNATSTAASTVYGAFTTGRLIRTGTGSLGSVVITGANTGIINFYNATTSSVLLRTGQKASSTILMASVPASAAAGDYVFDSLYTDGLLVILEGGIMPTTTITYR
jgi:hypothetical protein